MSSRKEELTTLVKQYAAIKEAAEEDNWGGGEEDTLMDMVEDLINWMDTALLTEALQKEFIERHHGPRAFGDWILGEGE